jgi:hypothetical protein
MGHLEALTRVEPVGVIVIVTEPGNDRPGPNEIAFREQPESNWIGFGPPGRCGEPIPLDFEYVHSAPPSIHATQFSEASEAR